MRALSHFALHTHSRASSYTHTRTFSLLIGSLVRESCKTKSGESRRGRGWWRWCGSKSVPEPSGSGCGSRSAVFPLIVHDLENACTHWLRQSVLTAGGVGENQINPVWSCPLSLFPSADDFQGNFCTLWRPLQRPRARARACQRARLRRGPSDFLRHFEGRRKRLFFSFRALRPKRDQADSNSGKWRFLSAHTLVHFFFFSLLSNYKTFSADDVIDYFLQAAIRFFILIAQQMMYPNKMFCNQKLLTYSSLGLLRIKRKSEASERFHLRKIKTNFGEARKWWMKHFWSPRTDE